MASVGSVLLFVALHSFEVYAATSGVYVFKAYADASCSVLANTDYLKKVTGSADCYVYTYENGVTNGTSSFTLTCNGGLADHAVYESENCTGASVPSGAKPWFTKTMCSDAGTKSERFHRVNQELTVYSNYGSLSASCSKAYFPPQ